MQKKIHRSPQSLLIQSFAMLILIGTAVLSLPALQRIPISLLDCFFIATSAVCVTGLSTVNFAAAFNSNGQLVVALLMQFGGLGILTFALLAFRIIGAQLSLTSQAALTDSVLQRDAADEFREIFWKIIGLVLAIEISGAIVLTVDRWGHGENFSVAIWQGSFHAISAFCNAGFSLWSNSLESQDHLFVGTTMTLVFIGGIGQLALVQIFYCARDLILRHPPTMGISYNTRVVMLISLVIIALGSLVLWTDNTANYSYFHSLFMAVSARTAGFTISDPEAISLPNRLWMISLMFIGGSPGSCAGGIKITTFAIWLATCLAVLRNESECVFLGRQIPEIMVSRARKLIQFSILWNLFGIFLLVSSENGDFLTLLFEQISAFGTCGLTINFTPQLSTIGKFWIILSMFVGRLGPLTMALSVSVVKTRKYSYPEGRIMIG